MVNGSSSDSDSDPEGGELPDIPYIKEEQTTKKKSKKKRSEKAAEERTQRHVRKREVKHERGQITTTLVKNLPIAIKFP